MNFRKHIFHYIHMMENLKLLERDYVLRRALLQYDYAQCTPFLGVRDCCRINAFYLDAISGFGSIGSKSKAVTYREKNCNSCR